jgi:hypothetical protein
MNCWFNLGSDQKTLEEYRRKAAEGKNFIYIDEEKDFKDLDKEFGESMSAACPTVETSSITKERLSKKKGYELLRPKDLIQIAKELQQQQHRQQQKQQIIAPKILKRRRRR